MQYVRIGASFVNAATLDKPMVTPRIKDGKLVIDVLTIGGEDRIDDPTDVALFAADFLKLTGADLEKHARRHQPEPTIDEHAAEVFEFERWLASSTSQGRSVHSTRTTQMVRHYNITDDEYENAIHRLGLTTVIDGGWAALTRITALPVQPVAEAASYIVPYDPECDTVEYHPSLKAVRA